MLRKNNLHLSLLGIFLLTLFWIIYPGRLPVIYETQSLIVNLKEINKADLLNQFYMLLSTPAYNLLKPIYQNPTFFFIASIISEISLTILIFILLYFYSKNTLSSFITVIIFSPLLHEVINTLLNISFFQSFSSGIGWGSVNFSVRYLVGLFFLISLFCYLKKYYFIGIFFVSLSLLTHPNSGLFIVSFFIAYELYSYFFLNTNLKKLIVLLLLSLIFFLPTIFNVIDLFSLLVEGTTENNNWYYNMVRDEVDDFSVLWQIYYTPFTFLLHISFILLTIIIHFLFKKNNSREDNFLILFISFPLLGSILFVIIEITLPVSNYLLTPLLVSLQPGHKILSLSIFPLMFYWSSLITIFEFNFSTYKKFLYILTIIIFLGGLFTSLNSAKKQINYFKKISDIDINDEAYFNLLLNYSKLNNHNNPTIPKMYMINDFDSNHKNIFGKKSLFELFKLQKNFKKIPDKSYNQKYGNLSVYENLNKLIRKNIEVNSGLVIPPYLLHIRDSFPEYKIFLQEHHDGNIAMGNKKIFHEIEKRMKLLIGTNYLGLPPQQISKLNFSYMRKLFLERNEEHFINLRKNYKEYNLLITETSHSLKFDILAKNNNFIIYRIK